jgi:hypothetical protein
MRKRDWGLEDHGFVINGYYGYYGDRDMIVIV